LLVFFAVVLVAALADGLAAVFVAAFPADLLTAFLAVLLRACFAARVEAARFLRGAGVAASGGTIIGSETRPSAASGM
jgi:hypothetical protein